MGKVFGILTLVVAMWAGAEVYNNGLANAFGGVLTTLGWAEAEAPENAGRSTGHRVGAAVIGAQEQADERRERMLAE